MRLLKFVLFAALFLPLGSNQASAYDPNIETSWNMISKIDVRMPDGSRKFASLLAQSRYGKDPTNQIFSPFVMIENSGGGTAIYPVASSPSLKSALCELSNGSHLKPWDKPSDEPMEDIQKAVPMTAIVYGPDGFELLANQTKLAAKITCLVNRAENYDDKFGPSNKLADVPVVRKSDGAKLKGELRGTYATLNPFGRPYHVASPQLYIDGIFYDIWGGEGISTGRALCTLIDMDNVNSGTSFHVSPDKVPVVVFKNGQFILYPPMDQPKIADSFGCGRTGGDGSQ
jgi:hypothetical protein